MRAPHCFAGFGVKRRVSLGPGKSGSDILGACVERCFLMILDETETCLCPWHLHRMDQNGHRYLRIHVRFYVKSYTAYRTVLPQFSLYKHQGPKGHQGDLIHSLSAQDVSTSHGGELSHLGLVIHQPASLLSRRQAVVMVETVKTLEVSALSMLPQSCSPLGPLLSH